MDRYLLADRRPARSSPLITMFLLTLWLIMTLVAPPASAAPECYPWDSEATSYELSTSPESKAGFLMADAAEAAFVVTWFCDARYAWKPVGFVGWRRNLTAHWHAVAASLRDMTTAERDAVWASQIRCEDLKADTAACAEYRALAPLLARQFAATRPQAIVWLVRDNPTSTSRPVFALTSAGLRNTTAVSAQRVSDTEVCACIVKALEESGGTYCEVGGARNVATSDPSDVLPPGRVALCVRE